MLLPNCAKHDIAMIIWNCNILGEIRATLQLWQIVSGFSCFWQVTGIPKVATNGNQNTCMKLETGWLVSLSDVRFDIYALQPMRGGAPRVR